MLEGEKSIDNENLMIEWPQGRSFVKEGNKLPLEVDRYKIIWIIHSWKLDSLTQT